MNFKAVETGTLSMTFPLHGGRRYLLNFQMNYVYKSRTQNPTFFTRVIILTDMLA